MILVRYRWASDDLSVPLHLETFPTARSARNWMYQCYKYSREHDEDYHVIVDAVGVAVPAKYRLEGRRRPARP